VPESIDYFLGVDGGQSSTIAVIGDGNGKIVGWSSAGPCNHVGASEGRTKFLQVMGECLSRAAVMAGLNPEKPAFRAACLGMSGGPDDKSALLHDLLASDHIIITHDARIALAGATGGKPGVIVIAGTGSMAYAENEAGETARAGGWGFIFGDEGGGFDIVRQALRAALREHEGWGPRTALTPAIIEAAGALNADEALHRFYTAAWPRSRVASLATLVNQIAEAGDPAAIEIFNNAAQHLALLAASVRRQLWNEGQSVRLSWAGGVFGSEILLERFKMLGGLDAGISSGPPEHSPAIGALLVAYKSAGVCVDPPCFTHNKA